MAKLMGYDFEIQYKEGKENRVADALSKVVTMQALSMVYNEDEDMHQWLKKLCKISSCRK